AMYGIDHAQSLAIIAPRLYEHEFENKKEKLAQYGKRVWKLEGNDNDIAKQAIEKTESFFKSLGVKTKISDYTEDYSDADDKIKQIFIDRGWLEMGERKAIQPDDVKQIVKAAY
ncbi:MAG: iron-containing alcohol dehydrogenase, partial [Crocinitomicaceae bacterium]